jgi:hypothetical protein
MVSAGNKFKLIMRKYAKFWMLCVVAMFSAMQVKAQDLIVLNNDAIEELQVKIVEVSDSAVKYKKWTYQDGPTFSVSTSPHFKHLRSLTPAWVQVAFFVSDHFPHE